MMKIPFSGLINFSDPTFQIWLSITVYLVSFFPVLIEQLSNPRIFVRPLIGFFAFMGLIGYIVILSTAGGWALGRISVQSGLGIVYSIVLIVTVPLGKQIGSILIRRESKIKDAEFKKLNQLKSYRLMTNFYIYPLISFTFTLTIMLIVFVIKRIVSGPIILDIDY
jgi:hypothetical protein